MMMTRNGMPEIRLSAIARSILGRTTTLNILMLTMLCLAWPPLNAQTFYGSIAGTVTDNAGGVIPGATVTAINLGTNEQHSMKTDATGEYRFVDLVPATYRVEVQAANFKHFVQDQVAVLVGNSIRVDAKLEIGTATEIVEVTTAPPMLQTESGTVASQVEGKVVEEMPLNGRNAMNLIELVPGVIPQTGTSGAPGDNVGNHTQVSGFGNYAIAGGIANESANYIDGAPNNLLQGNTVPLILTQDAVQEFQVATNSISAEYGHFGGGVVNMTSKSGTMRSMAGYGSMYATPC